MIQLWTKKIIYIYIYNNGAEPGIWLYSVSNVTDQSRVHCSDTHIHTQSTKIMHTICHSFPHIPLKRQGKARVCFHSTTDVSYTSTYTSNPLFLVPGFPSAKLARALNKWLKKSSATLYIRKGCMYNTCTQIYHFAKPIQQKNNTESYLCAAFKHGKQSSLHHSLQLKKRNHECCGLKRHC